MLLFGGPAKDRPYPGSTTVTAVNNGGALDDWSGRFATEPAPVRVNAIHPGLVGDSEAWENNSEMLDGVRAKTPTGRTITVGDVRHATVFLLANPAVNGVNLATDGGWVNDLRALVQDCCTCSVRTAPLDICSSFHYAVRRHFGLTGPPPCESQTSEAYEVLIYEQRGIRA